MLWVPPSIHDCQRYQRKVNFKWYREFCISHLHMLIINIINILASISYFSRLQSPPFLMLKAEPEETDDPNDRYEGYCADLAREVATNMGFQYLLKEVPDSNYGSLSNDGTWNGMVGELTEGVWLFLHSLLF